MHDDLPRYQSLVLQLDVARSQMYVFPPLYRLAVVDCFYSSTAGSFGVHIFVYKDAEDDSG